MIDEVAKWQRRTFGWKVTPEDAAARLRKELDEFLENPTPEEAADCVITAIDLFRSIENDEPLVAVCDKHAINVGRSWRVSPDGTGQHVEE